MFLGKDAHLESELTKCLSSMRLVGVVRFRSLGESSFNMTRGGMKILRGGSENF